MRFIEIAASITTRADGHGIIPPDTPSASRLRHVTCEPSAPGGKCVSARAVTMTVGMIVIMPMISI